MKSVIFLCLIVLPACAAHAGEFEGTYDLEYPDLNMTFNFGLMIGGWGGGFEVELDMDEFPEEEFFEIRDLIFEMIDNCPFLTEEEKDELKAMINEALEELRENWPVYAQQMRDTLPQYLALEQGDWIFESIMTLQLEENDWEWLGFIDVNNGHLEMLPLILPVDSAQTPVGSLTQFALLDARGDIFRDEDYYGTGEFAYGAEFVLVNPAFIMCTGLGLKGQWEMLPAE